MLCTVPLLTVPVSVTIVRMPFYILGLYGSLCANGVVYPHPVRRERALEVKASRLTPTSVSAKMTSGPSTADSLGGISILVISH